MKLFIFSLVAVSAIFISVVRLGAATPGVALIKDQEWTDPKNATPIEFTDYTNRTGYIEFTLKSGKKSQIGTARVVKLIPYPSDPSFDNLITPEDRTRFWDAMTVMGKATNAHPASKALLAAPLALLTESIKRYDQGEVKVKTVWLAKVGYAKIKAEALEKQLRRDMEDATSLANFDLEDDPRFIDFKKLGDEFSAIKPFVNKLLLEYNRKVKETQQTQAAPATEKEPEKEVEKKAEKPAASEKVE